MIYRAIKAENHAIIKRNRATKRAIVQEFAESRNNSCATLAILRESFSVEK